MNRNRPARQGFGPWLRRQLRQRPKPVWVLVVTDTLLLVVSLLVFALFHHVLPRHQQSVGLISSRDAAAGDRSAIAATADETDLDDAGGAQVSMDLDAMSDTSLSFSGDEGEDGAEGEAASGGDEGYGDAGNDAEAEYASEADAYEGEEAASDEADAQPAGNLAGDLFAGIPKDFGETFADKFTDGKVIKSSSGYQSANVNIGLKRYQSDKQVFYVADIYVRDISCLVTAFAKDQYGMGIRQWAGEINTRIGGVIAINGDYYGGRSDGVVIRNGELYRSDSYLSRDICVLFWDGTMETYGAGKFNAQAAIDSGAYQAWNFGPRLLNENGKAKTSFHSEVGPANPRTAIGYFEPGHYCFVVVEGRSKNSSGMTLTELAALMEELGCVRAYNLDGGNTSTMVVGDKSVNTPSGGGRPTSDIIAIVDKN